MSTIIQQKRGTASQWAASSYILSAGEFGWETDTNRFKIGNGTTAWNSLPYASPALSSGVPSGGTTGQILAKNSGTNYDTGWIDNYTSQVQQYVKNGSGSTLYKGQAVYVTGASGANVLIGLAKADTEATSSKTVGLLMQDLAPNAFGYVMTDGTLTGIDTTGATTEGDPVWLSPSTAGGLIYGLTNKPYGPSHLVYIGVVTRKNVNNGSILVKVQNGFELQELHNVGIGYTTAPSDKDLLVYENSTSLWKNKSFSTLGLATSSYVDTSIANLVASAPSTLDTLNELAAALGNDASFATTVTTSLAGKVSLTGSYTNPSWLVSIPFSKLTSTPTTLSGYGITDALTSATAASTYLTISNASNTYAPISHTHGNISNGGAIGSTANLVTVTGTSGVLTVATSTNQSSTTFLRGDLTWVTPTDTNTYPTTWTWTNGTSAGPTASITGTSSTISVAAIPTASATVSGIVTTGAQTIAGVKTFNSFPEVSGTPSTSNQLVNKTYVDNIASGINAHDAVVAATTGALTATYNNNTTGIGATLTNSGTLAALVIDNVSLNSGDRVLVKNQGGTSTSIQNGIYTVTTVGSGSVAWVLTRASDYDQSVAGEVAAGDTTFVVAPSAQFSTTPTNQNTSWTMNVPGTITIGSSVIGFVNTSSSTAYTAGNGLQLNTGQFAIDTAITADLSTAQTLSNKTLTTPKIDSISTTTGGAATPSLWSDVTTGTITAGSGLTTGTLTLGGTSTISSGTRNINLGTGVVNAAGTIQNINIGTGAPTAGAASNINIGATGSTTTVTGTLTVPNTSFTYSKLQNVTTQYRLLGRISAGGGVIEELSPDNLITTLNQAATALQVGKGGTGTTTAPVAGAIPYGASTSALGYTAAGTAAGQVLRSGTSGTGQPAWSTSIFADTYAVNTLLYAGTANQVSGLATANNGVLVTSGSGVPSISSSLPAAVTPTAPTSTATTASGVGYIGLPQNATTSGAYPIVLADAGTHIYASATRTVTIPANSAVSFAIGTTITFIAGSGATMTIAITTDTMYLAGTGTTGSRTLAPFGMATAVKIGTTQWIISGNGLT